jgi:hypothetical protein
MNVAVRAVSMAWDGVAQCPLHAGITNQFVSNRAESSASAYRSRWDLGVAG